MARYFYSLTELGGVGADSRRFAVAVCAGIFLQGLGLDKVGEFGAFVLMRAPQGLVVRVFGCLTSRPCGVRCKGFAPPLSSQSVELDNRLG